MSTQKSHQRFYITTAIDYPNGSPHMGHAYEKIITDTYARWYRFLGYETYFLTGTDENGQKLVKAAAESGEDTRKFVDRQVETFKNLCRDLQLSNDSFIRTTDAKHQRTSQHLWSLMEKKGDIYFGQYEGFYCLACEAFYTKLQAPDLKCPNHGTALDSVKEEGFFFKLGKYKSWIIDWIKAHPNFVRPESARKEILNRLEGDELRDLSISRPNAGWGVAVPNQPNYVMYTWFDALINYYTEVSEPPLNRFWPADVHVIGKDITWFHSVIWPCMLYSAGIEIPKQIYVHGMVLGQDGKKMSKSLGNGVDPYEIIKNFPLDSFRYYLLRAIPSGLDGAFIVSDLIARHNNELANDYGNLLMRVTKLGLKKLGASVDSKGVKSEFDFRDLGARMSGAMENREHHLALEYLWVAINDVNMFITRSEPWKKEGNDPDFKRIIYNALYGIHCFASLISAFLPQISAKTFEFLGTKNAGLAGLKFGEHNFQLVDPTVLFPKIEAKKN